MKIGIISIFDNHNFGNRLQNYSLKCILEKQNSSTVTIRNKPYSSGKSRLLRKLFLSERPVIYRLLGQKRKAEVLTFTQKNICISRKNYWYDKPYETMTGADDCELYCAGSDQVWNPKIHRHTMFNYLGFAETDRTFSYAASFGIDRIPEEYAEDVRKGLNHIKYISVREDAGKRIVEELTGRTDVQVLVDPTMLLTPVQWDEVAEKPKKELPEKYLLTYFLGEVSPQRRATIEAKAKELGCKTIWLMDKQSPFYAIGPGHFVYLIKHAQMVCTDSFHGSVFSFLYGRPLAIYDRKGSGENMSSRLETLAAKFSLRGQMVQDENLEAIPVKPDYSAGYLALEEERKRSKAFLNMVFEEAERAGLCK